MKFPACALNVGTPLAAGKDEPIPLDIGMKSLDFVENAVAFTFIALLQRKKIEVRGRNEKELSREIQTEEHAAYLATDHFRL